MGLAASQARLLSLTSRQHTLEYDAQRLMNNKMRLANDSDKAYQVYVNALSDTALKTIQYNKETGGSTWINGSINNLLRYQTSEKTNGFVFYVQDMNNGKLHVPEEIGNKYDIATDARNFAEQFGITYTEVDHNAIILTKYEEAIRKGWNTLMTEEQLEQYDMAVAKDSNLTYYASMLGGVIPHQNDSGSYEILPSQTALGGNYVNNLKLLMGKVEYTEAYTATERAILEKSLQIYEMLDDIYPTDITEGSGTDINGNSYTSKKTTYVPTLLAATLNGTNNYIEITNGEKFSVNDAYLMMLNGGTQIWEGLEIVTIDYPKSAAISDLRTESTKKVTKDIYDASVTTLLTQYNTERKDTYNNLGQAISAIFDRVANSKHYEKEFLAKNNLSETDVKNYKEYLNRFYEKESYSADIEFIPSDKVKGPYYEQIYNAIKSAGGWIGASDGRAKNDTWVQNMIKNGQVILTTWDEENQMLSKTSPSLNTKIKEVTDNAKVSKASQKYEEEMAIINDKDTKYDTILSKLESERSALTTEIDAIENVMGDNVKKYFGMYT